MENNKQVLYKIITVTEIRKNLNISEELRTA